MYLVFLCRLGCFPPQTQQTDQVCDNLRVKKWVEYKPLLRRNATPNIPHQKFISSLRLYKKSKFLALLYRSTYLLLMTFAVCLLQKDFWPSRFGAGKRFYTQPNRYNLFFLGWGCFGGGFEMLHPKMYSLHDNLIVH